MHKGNVHRNTDSIRIARATQVRLDEIRHKIEQEKHRSMKSNYQEKIKIWNELKSIRRVFEPLYVLKKDHDKPLNDQSAAKPVPRQNHGHHACNFRANREANAVVKQPRIFRRAETQSNTVNAAGTQRRNTIMEGRMLLAHNSLDQVKINNPTLMRARSYSWSPASGSESCGTRSSPSEREHVANTSSYSRSPASGGESCGSRSSPSEREHVVKPRNAVDELRVSQSMSSVTMGYLTFKRVLKNQRQSESMERKVVDSKFRSMSMDEAELSVNSRLLTPEQSCLYNEQNDLMAGTSWTQKNPHLVKKGNKKSSGSRKLSSAPVSKRQIHSSLSWPLGELPMRSRSQTQRNDLLTPDLLRAKSAQVPSRKETLVKKRSEIKIEVANRGKSPGAKMQERSSESDEEEKFGTFSADNQKFKILFRNNKHTRLGNASKLFKPLGTGCFSESFQAESQ